MIRVALTPRIPIVVDAETEPDDAWIDRTRDEFMASLEPPANYSKPETIKRWMDEQLEDRRSRAPLSSIDGRITAIACAPLWGDGEPHANVDRGDEAGLLAWFMAELDEMVAAVPDAVGVIAGFAVADFDVPFLTARAALHRVQVPTWWPDRPHRYGAVLDAHEILGPKGKLDLWLKRYGLPPKSGEGSLVQTYLDEELRAYVSNDVAVERALLRHLAVVSPEIAETLGRHLTPVTP